ncbi:MAG: phospho-N-acetylmuramoyl-pentapeptide-transferase, partial [Bacteroidales bacterium]|nr:phospho-N-acetylmuramoyl-pentapeptide-transferase [Bacteroidales bacterium]
MLYYLSEWLYKNFDTPGAGLLNYISVRAAAAIIVSLIISLLLGKSLIKFLRKKQIGEEIRELGLQGQIEKKGTPTMGGILIIASILIPVLLFTKLTNIYIMLMIFTTLWLGALGFADDYIKVFKKNKEGLPGKTKLIGQILLGIVVGSIMYFDSDVVIKEKNSAHNQQIISENVLSLDKEAKTTISYHDIDAKKSTITTIPFVKDNEFDYSWITQWMGDKSGKWSAIFYILIITFIIAAVSNGANLTDGLDGLTSGVSAFVAVGIAILAYVSGNVVFSDYLNIMFIPNISEIVVYAAAFIGACIGFYWWNCFPAKIFMGDTGSLAIGGIIAVLCVIIRKEFLIPILCGVFFIETISVIIQRYYFKYTKKKYGEGKRYFLMAPLH